ncbi:MAG: 3-dehydroquinate synthase [Candidatus Omnitrophota bacterium]|jgi:3-dehydroquinate synthase
MKTIKVKLRDNSYDINIGLNLFNNISDYINKLKIGNFAVIVTSRSVCSYYKTLVGKSFKRIQNKIIVLPDGENAKTKESLFKIIDGVIKADKIGRKIFIVCLGGGTIGDVGGFAASIYKRGISYVQIPTTLLSQIDASIGGKTAIDLSQAKNILGSFCQPKAVFIDPVFLQTLAKNELKEGLAEAVKYGIIKDSNFFHFLENNYQKVLSLQSPVILKVIETCAKIKAGVVEEDEKEKKGVRTLLNFGHTLAHAIETASEYKKISHGAAVSVGMVYAAYLSYNLGFCGRQEINEVKAILYKLTLPTQIDFDYAKIYKAMNYDKKFIRGSFRFVALRKIGKAEVVENVSKDLVCNTLRKFNSSQESPGF